MVDSVESEDEGYTVEIIGVGGEVEKFMTGQRAIIVVRYDEEDVSFTETEDTEEGVLVVLVVSFSTTIVEEETVVWLKSITTGTSLAGIVNVVVTTFGVE